MEVLTASVSLLPSSLGLRDLQEISVCACERSCVREVRGSISSLFLFHLSPYIFSVRVSRWTWLAAWLATPRGPPLFLGLGLLVYASTSRPRLYMGSWSTCLCSRNLRQAPPSPPCSRLRFYRAFALELARESDCLCSKFLTPHCSIAPLLK